jgi:osmotically inducible protein OsmC
VTARNGSADWRGDLKKGSGTVTVGNGVFQGAYTYGTRFGEDTGTNPEQLIAAAQASCFTMALAALLSAAGHAPQSLRTNAHVDMRNIAGAPTLARLEIDTEGYVVGVDEQEFQRYAEDAKKNCPVARALAGIPEITLTARLAAAAA